MANPTPEEQHATMAVDTTTINEQPQKTHTPKPKKKKVSFHGLEEEPVVVPDDLLDKYEEAYQQKSRKYIGIKEYERAAVKMQRFLKPHILTLILHNDAEAEMYDELESVLDLKKIELDDIAEDKEEQLAEIRAEWEEELEALEAEEIQQLQMDRSLRYETMEEIDALKKEYVQEKEKHTKYQAKLDKEKKKAAEMKKLGKLKKRQWKQVRLLREVEDNVEDLQSQLDKVEEDVATVTKQNARLLATIEQVAEKLDSHGLNYFEMMRQQPQLKQPVSEQKPERPAVDGSGAPHTPPKIDGSVGTTPVVEEPVPCKKQETKIKPPKRKSSKKTATASPLSVVDETQELKESQPTRGKSKEAKVEATKEGSTEPTAATNAAPNRRKTPGRRPTFLLNRIKGTLRLPSTNDSTAKQELQDQRQRFAHAREFSTKELNVRSSRPVHLLSKDSGCLQLEVR